MKRGPFDPAIAQWALRDQAAFVLLAMIFGGVGIFCFLGLSAIIETAAARNILLLIIGILVLIVAVLALRLIRLHRMIEKLEERVP